MKKYVVELTEDEREYLYKLISAGSASARMLNRARIPAVKADPTFSLGYTGFHRELASEGRDCES